jgi:hypothetical protein
MANTNPETLQDLMDEINTNVSNDSDTPTSANDSDEWNTRLNLIYTAIRLWGNSKDVFWNELWKTYISVTTLSGTTTYVLSDLTDYRLLPPKALLRITLNGSTGYVRLIKPQEAQAYVNSGNKAAYITGSQKAGFTLNLTWTPAAGDGTFGGTFAFDYYKFPFKPTATTDKLEMSDPNYIVFYVSAMKALLESQNNKYAVFDAQAEDCMDNMVIMNDLSGDGLVENTDALDSAVIGE